jgi:hypothetical protein
VENSLASDEIKLPEMMQKRYQNECHQYVLKKLDFCLVNQMQLTHDTCNPQTNQKEKLYHSKGQISPITSQFSMAVIQKNC